LQYDYRFKDIYFLSKNDKIKTFDMKNIYFSPIINTYFPINSYTTSHKKQNSFSIVGAEVGKKDDSIGYFLEVGGALAGESDGYAEYFFGVFKEYKHFLIKGYIGAAGGGQVSTKGGLASKLSLKTNFSNINFEGGYYQTLEDGFKASFLNLSYKNKFDLVTYGKKYKNSGDIKYKKFSFNLYNESYLPSKTIRKDKDDTRLDNISIDVNYYLNKNFYSLITAQAAYEGGSGGYATGLFGVGYIVNSTVSPFVKFSIGAAGGGRVDVGGGIISKAEVGVKYKGVFLSAGRIKALEGKLDTYTASIGIYIDFYRGYI
jgi:hypothetical protein